MLCKTEIITKKISVPKLVENYWRPKEILPLCKECPDYAKVWSCPPGIMGTEIFKRYLNAIIIGAKVIYSDEALSQAQLSREDTETVRAGTYSRVKNNVFKILLNMEKLTPPSYTVAAGHCEICNRCARRDGLVCRNPRVLRYSFSSLGFDIGRLSTDLLDTPLLWANNGLPSYNMAIYAFLENSEMVPNIKNYMKEKDT